MCACDAGATWCGSGRAGPGRHFRCDRSENRALERLWRGTGCTRDFVGQLFPKHSVACSTQQFVILAILMGT